MKVPTPPETSLGWPAQSELHKGHVVYILRFVRKSLSDTRQPGGSVDVIVSSLHSAQHSSIRSMRFRPTKTIPTNFIDFCWRSCDYSTNQGLPVRHASPRLAKS